jgi:hypothetical protein
MYVGIDVNATIKPEIQGESNIVALEKELSDGVMSGINGRFGNFGDFEVLVSTTNGVTGVRTVYVYGVESEVYIPTIESALKKVLPRFIIDGTLKAKTFIDNDAEDTDEITGFWEVLKWSGLTQ